MVLCAWTRGLHFAFNIDEKAWSTCGNQVSISITTESLSILKHSALSKITKICHITKGKVSCNNKSINNAMPNNPKFKTNNQKNNDHAFVGVSQFYFNSKNDIRYVIKQ